MNLKLQGDPNMDTSDSDDENQNVECSHINKAVDLQKIKKSLTRLGFQNDCDECKKLPAEVESEDIDYDMTLWLCLKCGNQACGRGRKAHALKHYKTPHSDSHGICVNTTIWSVWCYECDDEVNITCKKKLQEAVEYLKKQSENAKSNEYKEKMYDQLPVLSISNNTGTTPKIMNMVSSNAVRARGLSNLGNTCFFNSVMQCLAQTPYLVQLLEETSQDGQYFKLPGGEMKQDSGGVITLPPLEGALENWKPLPETLATTLRELQSGRSEVYNPRMLLSRLTARMPQFGGGDQHDSHELLRHLLEAVREEDLKRYKTVILQKLGYNNKTNPSTVEGEQKKIIKFYGQQASEMQSPTEQVFRGVLVSTLQCQVCDHTSHRDEFFLDLSLPISEKQLPPVLRRKADEIDDNKSFSHQSKSAKKSERKKRRQKCKIPVNIYNNQIAASPDVSLETKSDSESDADIEDNLEESSNVIRGVEFPKNTESGYNSDKIDNSSPDSNIRLESPTMRVDDSGVPSPVIGILNSPISPENSSGSSEINVDMGSPSMVCGNNSPSEEMGDFERPQSRLAFVSTKNTDLKVDLEKLSLLNDGDSSKINSMILDNENNNMEGACGPPEPLDEKMEEGDCDEAEDVNLWSETIAPRYQCEEGECSIQSCLNQFTECELMAGNNKVACELCTKRHGGPSKKTIYTDASKQLLIYNPPAVLILHLKRFQVLRFRSAKMSKFVKFSTLLDLAPFCSKRSQNLPTIEVGQNKVLYSLYGIVEHSGSIHGGHYVAYVKVRPPLEENSYRWQFIPKNQKEKGDNARKGAIGEPEVPAGKWYYISDSYVSEVPETKVLSAQAYLLFYERIM